MSEIIKTVKADLGCGKNKKQGFMGVDISASVKPDIVYDLTKGMPFGKDTVSEVYCSHFLEHITADEVLVLMNSMPEQCLNGALIEIRVLLNFEDPAHKQVLRHDWITWLVKSIPVSLILKKYLVETVHTVSCDGRPFFYEQATIIFKVMK